MARQSHTPSKRANPPQPEWPLKRSSAVPQDFGPLFEIQNTPLAAEAGTRSEPAPEQTLAPSQPRIVMLSLQRIQKQLQETARELVGELGSSHARLGTEISVQFLKASEGGVPGEAQARLLFSELRDTVRSNKLYTAISLTEQLHEILRMYRLLQDKGVLLYLRECAFQMAVTRAPILENERGPSGHKRKRGAESKYMNNLYSGPSSLIAAYDQLTTHFSKNLNAAGGPQRGVKTFLGVHSLPALRSNMLPRDHAYGAWSQLASLIYGTDFSLPDNSASLLDLRRSIIELWAGDIEVK